MPASICKDGSAGARRAGYLIQCERAGHPARGHDDRIVDCVVLSLISLGPTRDSAAEKEFGRVELAFAEHAHVAGRMVPEGLDPRGENPPQFGHVPRLCKSRRHSLGSRPKRIWSVGRGWAHWSDLVLSVDEAPRNSPD